MKHLLPLLLVVSLPVAAFAQGQINFNNYVPLAIPPVNAPATLWSGLGLGGVPGMKAQLFLLGAAGSRTAIGDMTTFRTSPAAAQPYIHGITVVVPGIDVGGTATVVMRAWNGATYDSSFMYLESYPVTITLGGGTSVPADLIGLQPMSIPLPEPSVLALAAAGSVLLLLRRKR